MHARGPYARTTMTTPRFTIGHSNRDLSEFLALRADNDIERIVDVRRLPGSTRYPQFNEDALRASLHEHGIAYSRSEALTGRRRVSKTVPFEVNAWWRNRSFHNYADHALSEEFRAGITELRELGDTQRTAVMCSEAVWWRCHRRIIADYLLAAGDEVVHVLGEGQTAAAELSSGAVMGAAEGTLTYPPDAE